MKGLLLSTRQVAGTIFVAQKLAQCAEQACRDGISLAAKADDEVEQACVACTISRLVS